MSFVKIGEGLSCSSKNKTIGVVKYIKNVESVIELIKEGAGGRICLIEQAGATILGPVFSKIAGVICTTGSKGSHIAIISREFEIPAYMSCKLNVPLEELDNEKIKLQVENETGLVLIWKE